MNFEKSMMISASGMRAQGYRMRIIAENIANQESVATAPGEEPYRRKTVSFKNVFDKEMGTRLVTIDKVDLDQAEFGRRYDPGHPGADDDGYIETPNVSGLIEMMDMRQAQRTYEANLNAIESSKNMIMRTIELLR